MHAISSYHGNRPTYTPTHRHRQDGLQYTAPQLASSVIKRPTYTPTHRHRQDGLQYTAPQLASSVIKRPTYTPTHTDRTDYNTLRRS